MTRAADQTHQRWTMHRHFEPSRVAGSLLGVAYEAALPVGRRRPVPGPVLPGREQERPVAAAVRRA